MNHNNEKYVNLTNYVGDKKYYEFNIKDGNLYNSNFEKVNKQQLQDSASANLGAQKEGWCEWAVGALCDGGGAAGCYGVAALGITTGIGDLSLATVCGIISILGCTTVTKKYVAKEYGLMNIYIMILIFVLTLITFYITEKFFSDKSIFIKMLIFFVVFLGFYLVGTLIYYLIN